jgi:hypothetical protein
MSQAVLGSYSFLDVPDVNGSLLLVNGGGTGTVAQGLLSARPAAGTAGNLYVASDTKLLYRDNGATWDTIGSTSAGIVLTFNTTAITPLSGTSLIPYDNTPPLITEGTQIWTTTVTPASLTSKFLVTLQTFAASGTATRWVILALFRGSTLVNAVATTCTTTNSAYPIGMIMADVPNTASPVTYSLRVGISSNATWQIGQTATANFGGTNPFDVTITEFAQ